MYLWQLLVWSLNMLTTLGEIWIYLRLNWPSNLVSTLLYLVVILNLCVFFQCYRVEKIISCLYPAAESTLLIRAAAPSDLLIQLSSQLHWSEQLVQVIFWYSCQVNFTDPSSCFKWSFDPAVKSTSLIRAAASSDLLIQLSSQLHWSEQLVRVICLFTPWIL